MPATFSTFAVACSDSWTTAAFCLSFKVPEAAW